MNVDFCPGKGRGGLHLEWILRDVLRWQTPELAKRTFYEFTVPSLPSMWKSGSFTLESMAPGLAGGSYLLCPCSAILTSSRKREKRLREFSLQGGRSLVSFKVVVDCSSPCCTGSMVPLPGAQRARARHEDNMFYFTSTPFRTATKADLERSGSPV